MHKSTRVLIVLIFIVSLVLLFYSNITKPYDRTIPSYFNVTINEGDGLEDVASRLEEEGIIANASLFTLIAKFVISTSIRPGTYYLSPSMSTTDILHTLKNGVSSSKGFTIPAGYNIEQIASSLERDGIVDKAEFFKAAASEDLQELDIIGKNNLGSSQIEGFLFPGEYSIDIDADEGMLIMTMLNQFINYFNDDFKARADELGLSIREVIYMASLIELETRVDKEKPAISAVIHNRYNLELITKDEIQSAPLCSPGQESIFAALYPEDNDNLYYVYSNKLDGTHVFTNNESEYESLMSLYRKAMEAE